MEVERRVVVKRERSGRWVFAAQGGELVLVEDGAAFPHHFHPKGQESHARDSDDGVAELQAAVFGGGKSGERRGDIERVQAAEDHRVVRGDQPEDGDALLLAEHCGGGEQHRAAQAHRRPRAALVGACGLVVRQESQHHEHAAEQLRATDDVCHRFGVDAVRREEQRRHKGDVEAPDHDGGRPEKQHAYDAVEDDVGDVEPERVEAVQVVVHAESEDRQRPVTLVALVAFHRLAPEIVDPQIGEGVGLRDVAVLDHTARIIVHKLTLQGVHVEAERQQEDKERGRRRAEGIRRLAKRGGFGAAAAAAQGRSRFVRTGVCSLGVRLLGSLPESHPDTGFPPYDLLARGFAPVDS